MGSPDEVRPRMEAFIALADVVKASDEDIAWLYPARFVPDVLRRWGALGASLAVVTRGGEGALYALNHVGSLAICEAAAPGVDTVGAGDSFMAGLLSGLLDAGLLGASRPASGCHGRPRSGPTGGRAGPRLVAVTVSRAGANPPRRDEICALGCKP